MEEFKNKNNLYLGPSKETMNIVIEELMTSIKLDKELDLLEEIKELCIRYKIDIDDILEVIKVNSNFKTILARHLAKNNICSHLFKEKKIDECF